MLYASFYRDLEKALASLERKDKQEEVLVQKLQLELATLRATCGNATPDKSRRREEHEEDPYERQTLVAEMKKIHNVLREVQEQLRVLTVSSSSLSLSSLSSSAVSSSSASSSPAS